jgi:hypothetical protein
MEDVCALVRLERCKIEGGPYAMPETRCETMQVADAFRAKRRRAIGKRLRIPVWGAGS